MRRSEFTGVKAFGAEEWCTYTQIGGVQTAIYVAKSEAECASAYNQYIKVMDAKGWASRLNNVAECHDVAQLIVTLHLIGTPAIRERMQPFVEYIDKFKAQGGN